MAHEINERDGQQGIFQAWHGLTDVVERVEFETSPLNWELNRSPLFTQDGKRFHQDAIVASDDGLPVGNAVSGSYGIIQNRQIWDALLGGLADATVPFRVASVGTYCDRTKISVAIELNEGSRFTVADREFEFYLTGLTTHDGSGRALFLDSSICTVCANTFNMNISAFSQKGEKELRFSIKHTKNASLGLINVTEGIRSLLSNRREFCNRLGELAAKRVNRDDAHFFSVGMVAPESAEDKGISTRLTNVTDELMALFGRGAGNIGENRLDLFSAFTDYYTHSNSGGNDRQKQLVSSEFGSGATMKNRVFGALSSEDGFNKMVKRGKDLILLA